jgi:hypothetical protein
VCACVYAWVLLLVANHNQMVVVALAYSETISITSKKSNTGMLFVDVTAYPTNQHL